MALTSFQPDERCLFVVKYSIYMWRKQPFIMAYLHTIMYCLYNYFCLDCLTKKKYYERVFILATGRKTNERKNRCRK
jgi:hypothetical protein